MKRRLKAWVKQRDLAQGGLVIGRELGPGPDDWSQPI